MKTSTKVVLWFAGLLSAAIADKTFGLWVWRDQATHAKPATPEAPEYSFRQCVCKSDGFTCGETSTTGYTCTRSKGHHGEHVSCGKKKSSRAISHRLQVWED